MSERRPFHETIVDQLEHECLDGADIEHLGRLIIATKIPANHDEIIKAWKAACRKVETDEDLFQFQLVIDDLREQKQEAEAEAAAKQAEGHRDMIELVVQETTPKPKQ